MPKYQINATIKKPGGGPVKWTHYSDFPMTAEECRKNFSKEKEAEMPPMRKHGAVIMKQEKLRLKHIVMNGERINHD
ncbi:DUF1187 family protein [Salmonella enterica]|uniref:DUF1187 family protein n=1 Tax=Salmonella enterica TaxID=28901 RepID=UPI0032E517B4